MKPLSETSIQFVKGVGPARKKLFEQLGVETIEDLFYLFPRRYEDRRHMTPLAEVKPGEWFTVSGSILTKAGRRTWFNKKHVFEAVIQEGSAQLLAVWFNQPYLDHYLQAGKRVVLYGKVDQYKNRLQMLSPEYEVIDEEDQSLSIGRIVPVYPLTRGMSQRYLRKVVKFALDHYRQQLGDLLPLPILAKHRLLHLSQAIGEIHFPENEELQKRAHERVAFEEFFFFQVSVILRRLSVTHKEGIAHRIEPEVIEEFAGAFPFSLTKAQHKVIAEISTDLRQASPMLRLLQGDVGSGKTLVAFFGCIAAWRNGRQSAFMAPTEILARQHFQKLQTYTQQGAFKGLRLELLVGSLKAEEKNAIYQRLKAGQIDVLIGTHALLEEVVSFKNLSYVVIDEQHKFGVRQRAVLSAKGLNPDVLIMTATPIPRTLCLTLYGDLDLSVLDELPPGRGKIRTKQFKEEQIEEVYAQVRKRVQEGSQAYIIYPLIEESEKLDLKAAKERFVHFSKEVFPDLRCGLVHGQLPKKETEKVMDAFKRKDIDILVATTILEVGIDVPNANVMVIEHAERFGLAQLHQLRGRIGRGSVDAYCLLVADPTTSEGQARIKAMLATTDGFKIAEEDLNIRGPGEFFGRHQHGLNELKIANPVTQIHVLELARAEAVALTRQDPTLKSAGHQLIRKIIKARYPTYLKHVEAG